MNIDQFRTQMVRLRKSFGEANYSDEVLMILWDEFGSMHELNFLKVVTECIATRPKAKPPLRNELRQVCIDLGLQQGAKSGWRYFEVDDCICCGGVGWYWIIREYQRSTLACDDCRAGKNLQISPKPTIRDFKMPTGWAWAAPGREKRGKQLHGVPLKHFGSWDGLERATRDNYAEVSALLQRYTKTVGSNGLRI